MIPIIFKTLYVTGDVKTIIHLVTKENYPPDKKMTDWFDSEPVGWAASFGELGALRCLIDLGAYPFTVNKANNDALTDAERERHTKCIKFLKAYKESSGKKEAGKQPELCSSPKQYNDSASQFLIEAAWDGNESNLRRALQEGADVTATGGQHNGTALNAAARNGHAGCIRILLAHDQKSDLNMKNIGWGHAPLHQAAFFNRTECAKLLLRAGADPHLKTGPGWEENQTAFQICGKCAGGPSDETLDVLKKFHSCADNYIEPGTGPREDQKQAFGWFESQGWKKKWPIHYYAMKGN